MKHHRITLALAAAALAAMLAAPVAADNPPPPAGSGSGYHWDVCKVGTSRCPIRYSPPKLVGQAAERAGKVWDNFRRSIGKSQ